MYCTVVRNFITVFKKKQAGQEDSMSFIEKEKKFQQFLLNILKITLEKRLQIEMIECPPANERALYMQRPFSL